MPSRLAILVGCPGRPGTKNYLPGVKSDLDLMRSYFCSYQGGYWYDQEVITLLNSTFREVRSLLVKKQVDYLIIYFSGHGCESMNQNNQYIYFADGMVEETKLFSALCLKQIVILDSCRAFIPRVSGIPEEPKFEEYSNFVGPVTRYLLDEAIQSSEDGLIIIRSCSAGQFSIDFNGGIFTKGLIQSLIDLGQNLKTNTPISFQRAVVNCTRYLELQNVRQRPELKVVNGDLQIPFGFAIPHYTNIIGNSQNSKKQVRSKSISKSPESDMLSLALTIFVVCVCLSIFTFSMDN